MSDHPHFYYWLYLLPVVLVAYWIIYWRQGKITPKGVFAHFSLLGLTYFFGWVAGLYQLITYPVVLVIFGYFIKVLFRARLPEQLIAVSVLTLFLISGLYAHRQQARYGSYWELAKEQDDGSFSWLANAALEKRFTKEQLELYLNSSDPIVRSNARKVAVQMGTAETDEQQARRYYERLHELDPELATAYYNNIPYDNLAEWDWYIPYEAK